MMMTMLLQVGPGDYGDYNSYGDSFGEQYGYELTVGGFNDALSTLGDSMYWNNGMKFSTK